MPYLSISNFEYGMDRRRPQDSGVPGTLWILKNGVISRGGDVVGAKKFVEEYTLPEGTHGMALTNGQPYVFGEGADPGVPPGVIYQQVATGGSSVVRILDAKPFDGLMYVVAEYDDGSIFHFYDGTRVTGWDTLAGDNSSFEQVADYLARKLEAGGTVRCVVSGNLIIITAKEAGTAYTITTATVEANAENPTAVDTELTANVAEVEEVLSTGTVQVTGGAQGGSNRITSVTVDGTELLQVPVPWVNSNASTAVSLSNGINNNSETSGYTAEASGSTVTISAAPGTGTTPNGFVVVSTTTGVVTTADGNMSGGVDYVAPVAQVYSVAISGDTFDYEDAWHITIDGTTYKSTGMAAAMGTSVFVFKSRMWSTSGSLLRYCVLNDASDWTTTTSPATDAGFINISSVTEGARRLIGLAKYNGMLAIFSSEVITLYTISTDATENEFFDTLESTGALAPRCIVGYGNTDVYYLDNNGIRSIRARQSTDSPFVSDVGSAFDDFVQEIMRDSNADEIDRAVAAIEPVDGRYMLAIGGKIVVLSYFPASKITAWSYFEPGFTVTDFARHGRNLYVREGDVIRVYGGFDGNIYPDEDETPVLVETPFTTANDPAGRKDLQGFDAALDGDWVTKVLPDPTDPDKEIDVGVINRTTYANQDAKLPGKSTHVAFRMTCSSDGYRRLSSLALHYDKQDVG
jgi:hypothetical protein